MLVKVVPVEAIGLMIAYVDVSVAAIMLNTNAEIVVTFHTATADLVSTQRFWMGELAYADRGVDDAYVVDIALAKFSLTREVVTP